MAVHVIKSKRAAYAESDKKEASDDAESVRRVAIAATLVIWHKYVAKVAVIAVSIIGRKVIRPQLCSTLFDLIWTAALSY